MQLKLPKMIDLTGITPQINPERWGQDHEVYSFKGHGALYVPCDYHAYFWANDYLEDIGEDRDAHNFNLGSIEGSMDRRQFQNFRMSNIDAVLTGLAGQEDKGSIIRTLKSYGPLNSYMESFFGWLNMFIERHGDLRWYNPLDGEDRYSEEFFERLRKDSTL
ncbi:MAG: hypothetical protein AABX00_00110 [Nanoarchaeota archaeon]